MDQGLRQINKILQQICSKENTQEAKKDLKEIAGHLSATTEADYRTIVCLTVKAHHEQQEREQRWANRFAGRS